MNVIRYVALAAALLMAACVGGGGDGTDGPDPEPNPDGIPLEEWVDAMVTAGENSLPDTVEDKLGIVIDTDDPHAFDFLLTE
jgi:hypothetical protein